LFAWHEPPPDAPSRPQVCAMAGWRLRYVRVNEPNWRSVLH
jgi:hypothetical protein